MIKLKKISALTIKEIFFLIILKLFKSNTFDKNNSKDLLQYSRRITELVNKGYNLKRENDNVLRISFQKKTYFIRRYSSDLNVFEQIFVNGEYNQLLEMINRAGFIDSPLTIVDCGSNIGLFSSWIMDRTNVKKVISIEADKENFDFQNQIFRKTKRSDKCLIINKAIWSDSDSVLQISSNFRDGMEWSRNVVQADYSSKDTLKSISLNQIWEEFIEGNVHILKIDIEGAEKVIFESESSFDLMLSHVKIIAIEIHREVSDRSKIRYLLQNYGFELKEIGETTFGFKFE